MRYLVFFVLVIINIHTLADDFLLRNQIPSANNTQQTSDLFLNNDPEINNSEIIEPKLSAAEAATLAQQQYPGQVMNVTLQVNTALYGVKILNNGRMKTVYVNAANGKVSSLSD